MPFPEPTNLLNLPVKIATQSSVDFFDLVIPKLLETGHTSPLTGSKAACAFLAFLNLSKPDS